MCFDFEMGFQGRNLNAEFKVFGISNQYKDFELDSNNTKQYLYHKCKHVLVNAYQSLQYDQCLAMHMMICPVFLILKHPGCYNPSP